MVDDDNSALPKVIPAPTAWGNTTYRDTIVGPSGKFSLDMVEMNKNSTIQFVDATLNLGKPTGESMYDITLQGVHFPQNGEIILVSTTPRKCIHGLRILIVDSKAYLSYRF